MTSGDVSTPRVSAIVPALDEAPSIERVVEGLKAQPLLASGEVIVVDNGSTDDTGELARRAGARVVREERRGYGQACLAGVLAAEDAEVVVLLDGDAADDPDDLPRVLAPLLEGEADLVVGSRVLGTRDRGSMTWQQVFGNKLASFMMRAIYGVRVTDVGPFRTIRREDLLALDMQEMTYGWPSEMIVKAARAGYRYQEVPVSIPAPDRGLESRRHYYQQPQGRLVHHLYHPPLLALETAEAYPSRDGDPPMTDVLYVIAKAPRVGLAKTRLGAAIGHEEAIELYKAFLRDLGARFTDAPFGFGWYITPQDAWPEISALAGETDRLLYQGEGDLTDRQRELFREATRRGERAVLIGSDAPHLAVEKIEEAFQSSRSPRPRVSADPRRRVLPDRDERPARRGAGRRRDEHGLRARRHPLSCPAR